MSPDYDPNRKDINQEDTLALSLAIHQQLPPTSDEEMHSASPTWDTK